MQRWWFLEENGDAKDVSAKLESSGKKAKPPKPSGDRRHTFRVLVTCELLKDETVAVTGSCESLGNWDPEQCVQMHPENDGTSNVWRLETELPREVSVTYRYLICSIEPTTENVHVRRFETHLVPRQIPVWLADEPADGKGVEPKIDTLGDINGHVKLDKGWLTTETIVQFKFFDNPFSVKDRIKNRLLYVKITTMNLRINAEKQSLSTMLSDESLSNDTRENAAESATTYSFTEVTSLGNANASYEQQSQFGCPYNKDDFLIFTVTVAEPENVAYLVDLYAYSSKSKEDELPYHLGYHYILPNFLKKSEGVLELPVTCASKHRPLGMMRIEYLKVTPLLPSRCTLERSYIRYWNKRWAGLDVGHRGSGTSFKANDGNVIRENTIASLKKAVTHGADMVEFDVQLSKDLVPVIYHDFDIYVSLKRKTTLETNDLLELPMRELTLEQLRNLKVYHVVEGRSREAKFFDEDLEEHQPFPQLAEALELIDPHCGFNIEIKWSQKLKDGRMESEMTFDSNLYVDCILRVVLEKAGNRRIVFSCFDADICTLLRLKQNLYPVMFLTLGVTSRYPSYHDPRCNSIEMAVRNAYATELLGIVAHTEDLLRDQTQVNLATEKGLIVFCWGDDNNCKDTIKHLKSLGIHAIIYDKMDIYSDKAVKESVFLVGARESQAALLQQIDIENRYEQTNQHDFLNDKDVLLNRDKMSSSSAAAVPVTPSS
ncbi:glycerophosphocholine phosphodiesterase GPCPD1 [Anopheles cruzii]|uniref:glycerophosphocholine phosphodiesterase GPCPD1 n=1 Tax=Anopheles cruzii TaxID=68878 RepID=UPI0022EC756A|nr:glycerophosphocholine phosphodiesterase GPCPD1 [Anopheles cruzii]